MSREQGFIKSWMLKPPFRNFVIWFIKAPLQKAIEKAGRLLPEPTLKNTAHPNTHTLIKLRDKFFEYEDNPLKKALLWAVFKILIIVYEHDIYYQSRIDWLIEELKKVFWYPRLPDKPDVQHWREHRDEIITADTFREYLESVKR